MYGRSEENKKLTRIITAINDAIIKSNISSSSSPDPDSSAAVGGLYKTVDVDAAAATIFFF